MRSHMPSRSAISAHGMPRKRASAIRCASQTRSRSGRLCGVRRGGSFSGKIVANCTRLHGRTYMPSERVYQGWAQVGGSLIWAWARAQAALFARVASGFRHGTSCPCPRRHSMPPTPDGHPLQQPDGRRSEPRIGPHPEDSLDLRVGASDQALRLRTDATHGRGYIWRVDPGFGCRLLPTQPGTVLGEARLSGELTAA